MNSKFIRKDIGNNFQRDSLLYGLFINIFLSLPFSLISIYSIIV